MTRNLQNALISNGSFVVCFLVVELVSCIVDKSINSFNRIFGSFQSESKDFKTKGLKGEDKRGKEPVSKGRVRIFFFFLS